MTNNSLALFTPEAISNLPADIRWAAKREGGAVTKEVMLAGLRDAGKAFLTNNAMQNTAALSALEQQLAELAPSGAGRYKYLADAYAMWAAKNVMGG